MPPLPKKRGRPPKNAVSTPTSTPAPASASPLQSRKSSRPRRSVVPEKETIGERAEQASEWGDSEVESEATDVDDNDTYIVDAIKYAIYKDSRKTGGWLGWHYGVMWKNYLKYRSDTEEPLSSFQLDSGETPIVKSFWKAVGKPMHGQKEPPGKLKDMYETPDSLLVKWFAESSKGRTIQAYRRRHALEVKWIKRSQAQQLKHPLVMKKQDSDYYLYLKRKWDDRVRKKRDREKRKKRELEEEEAGQEEDDQREEEEEVETGQEEKAETGQEEKVETGQDGWQAGQVDQVQKVDSDVEMEEGDHRVEHEDESGEEAGPSTSTRELSTAALPHPSSSSQAQPHAVALGSSVSASESRGASEERAESRESKGKGRAKSAESNQPRRKPGPKKRKATLNPSSSPTSNPSPRKKPRSLLPTAPHLSPPPSTASAYRSTKRKKLIKSASRVPTSSPDSEDDTPQVQTFGMLQPGIFDSSRAGTGLSNSTATAAPIPSAATAATPPPSLLPRPSQVPLPQKTSGSSLPTTAPTSRQPSSTKPPQTPPPQDTHSQAQSPQQNGHAPRPPPIVTKVASLPFSQSHSQTPAPTPPSTQSTAVPSAHTVAAGTQLPTPTTAAGTGLPGALPVPSGPPISKRRTWTTGPAPAAGTLNPAMVPPSQLSSGMSPTVASSGSGGTAVPSTSVAQPPTMGPGPVSASVGQEQSRAPPKSSSFVPRGESANSKWNSDLSIDSQPGYHPQAAQQPLPPTTNPPASHLQSPSTLSSFGQSGSPVDLTHSPKRMATDLPGSASPAGSSGTQSHSLPKPSLVDRPKFVATKRIKMMDVSIDQEEAERLRKKGVPIQEGVVISDQLPAAAPHPPQVSNLTKAQMKKRAEGLVYNATRTSLGKDDVLFNTGRGNRRTSGGSQGRASTERGGSAGTVEGDSMSPTR
ncbi:hypothetical protein IAT38_003245 [Cryptococcus sp. DSM 104549]